MRPPTHGLMGRGSPDLRLRQYLERYATSEARLGAGITDDYQALLVVPAHREPPGFLDQYAEAFESARGRVLVIVVVNAAAPNAAASLPEHEVLLASLRGEGAECLSSAPPVWLSRRERFDVLSIDRAHPDHCFPEREGVGLARRIGCDVALAAFAAGRIADPFIYCTDADAELPADYFDGPARAASADASCVVFRFWHVPAGDAALDAATALYELGLRYYVAGLAHAGSPYAYHSIGSALAVRADAYAAVRGFPRRLAGEDFYLLNKAAKVGQIWRDDARTIRLYSRASSRTVHGTGVAAAKLAAESRPDAAPFYHPEIFAALRSWLEVIEAFALERDESSARERIRSLQNASVDGVLQGLGAWDALSEAARQTRAAPPLRRRLHTWFDAFRTLKFIHALRERSLPSLPFREALALSPFRPRAASAESAVDFLRECFALEEAKQPAAVGLRAPNG
jgi:hypothetical protein